MAVTLLRAAKPTTGPKNRRKRAGGNLDHPACLRRGGA
jgi:hypothetical protein